jgi:hypothetical protein
VVIGVAGVAPRAIAFAFWALMQIAPIALSKSGNIGVTAQEMLARLLTNRKPLTTFHRFCLR